MPKYLEDYLDYLDGLFDCWQDASEDERGRLAEQTLDQLRIDLCVAQGQQREFIATTIEALEAARADFGF